MAAGNQVLKGVVGAIVIKVINSICRGDAPLLLAVKAQRIVVQHSLPQALPMSRAQWYCPLFGPVECVCFKVSWLVGFHPDHH